MSNNYYNHPTSIIETNDIGENTKIWHFAHIRSGVSIGKNCIIGKGVYIDKDVTIGDNVKIQNFVSIYKGVTIKDDVFIGPSATFTNDLYPRSHSWNEEDLTKTKVGKGASIGANSTIICGIKIGKHSMIGAGSVATKNIPDYALVYGNPAKIKGYICICGKKLQKKQEETSEHIVFICDECKKTTKVEKQWMKQKSVSLA